MLGPLKRHCLDAPITVSLETLVPRDNFYRHLAAKLDLGFVREWVRDYYAERGRPEPEAVARGDRMGPATRPLWQPHGPPEGSAAADGGLVIPSPAADGADPLT